MNLAVCFAPGLRSGEIKSPGVVEEAVVLEFVRAVTRFIRLVVSERFYT
jgi:hypothetical protein